MMLWSNAFDGWTNVKGNSRSYVNARLHASVRSIDVHAHMYADDGKAFEYICIGSKDLFGV